MTAAVSALPGATSPPFSTANRLKNRRLAGSVPTIPIPYDSASRF